MYIVRNNKKITYDPTTDMLDVDLDGMNTLTELLCAKQLLEDIMMAYGKEWEGYGKLDGIVRWIERKMEWISHERKGMYRKRIANFYKALYSDDE